MNNEPYVMRVHSLGTTGANVHLAEVMSLLASNVNSEVVWSDRKETPEIVELQTNCSE